MTNRENGEYCYWDRMFASGITSVKVEFKSSTDSTIDVYKYDSSTWSWVKKGTPCSGCSVIFQVTSTGFNGEKLGIIMKAEAADADGEVIVIACDDDDNACGEGSAENCFEADACQVTVDVEEIEETEDDSEDDSEVDDDDSSEASYLSSAAVTLMTILYTCITLLLD